MPIKTRPYIVSMATLVAMTSPTFTPFTCAHHWVTDQSIRAAMLVGEFDDPAIPWTAKTHRANRIASIASLMLARVQFPPLYVHCIVTKQNAVEDQCYLELADGHHRLRALQFLRRTDHVRLNVSGDVETLDRLVKAHRLRESSERFRKLMGPLWSRHDELVKQGYTLVEQVHDEWVYEAPVGTSAPMLPLPVVDFGQVELRLLAHDPSLAESPYGSKWTTKL